MTRQLFYYPGNASMAPHIILEELSVPHELSLVDRAGGGHKSPEYLKLNPNGLIPVLVDGDMVLYESAAICLYLCDAHPQSGLAPALGSTERAHFYKWLIWMTNTLQASLLGYFYPERWVDDGNAAGAAQIKAHAEKRIGDLLDQMEAQLENSGGPWFLGQRFTAVDAYAVMLCRWTRGFGRPARTLPRLGAYLSRVLERPAVRRALTSEGLTAPWV